MKDTENFNFTYKVSNNLLNACIFTQNNYFIHIYKQTTFFLYNIIRKVKQEISNQKYRKLFCRPKMKIYIYKSEKV